MSLCPGRNVLQNRSGQKTHKETRELHTKFKQTQFLNKKTKKRR